MNKEKNNFCKIKSYCKKIICYFCKVINKTIGNIDNVAVLNFSGIIGKIGKFENGLNIDKVNPLLEKAFSTKKLKAVTINVNSPGGSPVQSELIYQRIRELSEEKKIPVFTFAQDVAASGGYFIALAGEEIYAHDASIIGSIGGPCKQIAPLIEELSNDMGERIKIYKCNIDENPETPSKHQIRGVPTLMIFKKGKIVDTKVGSVPKSALYEWVNSNI